MKQTAQNNPGCRLVALILSALLLAILTGCTGRSAADATPTPSPTGSGATVIADTSAQLDLEFSATDLDVGYDADNATSIAFDDAGAAVTGAGAQADGSVVTIRSAGTYLLSGESAQGQVIVEAGTEDLVRLVLNNVSIHCEEHAAIYILEADQVLITLAEGSENALSGGAAYALTQADQNVDGVVFSKADLTINGSGSLAVSAAYRHGIVSKDDLVVVSGNLEVTANGQGLSGKDCVKIKDGVFKLVTQGDAIQSDNAEDAGRGFVYLAGGSYTIDSQGDAFQAKTVLRVDGGTYSIVTGGGADNAVRDSGFRGDWDGRNRADDATAQTEETASTKAFKAGASLLVNGGTFTIDAQDDALHSNGDALIAGGSFEITTGDDGLHADGNAAVNGGTLHILACYEGIEGETVTIAGGDVQIVATDDGLNAAKGGNDAAELEMPGKGGMEAEEGVYIRIAGGSLTVDASGDGLDSNGELYIEGGTVILDGPVNGGDGALDSTGTATISGGVLMAVGSSGMAQGFSTSSTQCSILCYLEESGQAGDTLTMLDASGDEVLSWTAKKQYACVQISAPALEQGQTYILQAGANETELTLSEVATISGSGGFAGGGGRFRQDNPLPSGIPKGGMNGDRTRPFDAPNAAQQ